MAYTVLDPYQPGDSPVHRLDPRIKFILAIGFILTTTLTPAGAWPVFILLLSVIFAVEILSGLGIPYVQKRSLLSLPFVLAAVPILFTLEGKPLFSFHFLFFSLTLYQPGLVRFLSIALKAWISVQAAVVLAATTEFPHLLLAIRAVRIPRLLVAIFGRRSNAHEPGAHCPQRASRRPVPETRGQAPLAGTGDRRHGRQSIYPLL